MLHKVWSLQNQEGQAPIREEFTHACVATRALQHSVLRRASSRHKAVSSLVLSEAGISDVSSGQGAGGASVAGRDGFLLVQGLLLFCAHSSALRSMDPLLPLDRPRDTPQSAAKLSGCGPEVWTGW